jgi:hypothetical protein
MSEERKSIADELLEDGLAVAQDHSETVDTADASKYMHCTICLYFILVLRFLKQCSALQ